MFDKAHVLDNATPAARMRKDGSMKQLMLTVGRASLTSICVLSLLLLGRPSTQQRLLSLETLATFRVLPR